MALVWMDALALFLWGALILKLWLMEQLYLLVHPNYMPMTVMAGVVLLGLAAGAVVFKPMQRGDHVALLQPRVSNSILIVVAIVGFVVEPRAFVSDKALHRGVTDNLAATRAVPQSFRATNRPEERTLVEWSRTLNAYPEPDAYTGQKAKVTGFVVHPPAMPEDIFLLVRFVLTCCAADAYPVSLPVQVEGDAKRFQGDQWLEVEGRMMTRELTGRRQLVVQASNLTPVPTPKNPYEY
ncbi:MAG: TIGR03943 family protein [Oscillatoriales cyanobacterium SM2_2_1]|nr:TIGR03943 family protein [Oscillatoriales cyanobacterium SM2_2_1]